MTITCRLCRGVATYTFETTLLNKYKVKFFRCEACGSLESEEPYWLAEAYGTIEASFDHGSARRVLDSFALVHLVGKLFRCHKLLDFGGNTGLLCRLLRDQGYDAYSLDRYISPTYAAHFVGSLTESYDLVSAFEVVEHFADPATDLDQIFGPTPKIVLLTTGLFRGQDAEWWYLAPLEGQHIFFYSERAARLIASRYGYNLLLGSNFLLFSRAPISVAKRLFIRVFFRPRVVRILRGIFLMRHGGGADRDYAALNRKKAVGTGQS